jgi:cell filamentation protein
MSIIRWRWEEKDFGFRFISGSAKRAVEYYQTANPTEFYSVLKSQRKLSAARIKELAAIATIPGKFSDVPSPWRDYRREWDWISTQDGICLNYAGCMDKEEIDRREDEGVARAMELVNELINRPAPVPLTADLIRLMHQELMGEIYPFAGEWRIVDLHKGDGPTKWPLPPGGVKPLMEDLENRVLIKSPVLSDDDRTVYSYVSEVMNELLAIHPFREGNGRTAFIVGNLILMQNDFLPLDMYSRRQDEARYINACEAGRLQCNYKLLTDLIQEWEEATLTSWQEGQ